MRKGRTWRARGSSCRTNPVDDASEVAASVRTVNAMAREAKIWSAPDADPFGLRLVRVAARVLAASARAMRYGFSRDFGANARLRASVRSSLACAERTESFARDAGASAEWRAWRSLRVRMTAEQYENASDLAKYMVRDAAKSSAYLASGDLGMAALMTVRCSAVAGALLRQFDFQDISEDLSMCSSWMKIESWS